MIEASRLLRKDVPLKHRNLYPIHYSLIQILYWSLLAAYYAFGATYLFALGLDSAQTGLVIAVAGLLSALIQPALASLADRYAHITTKKLAVGLAFPACVLLVLVWLPLAMPLLDVILYGAAWMLIMALQFLISSFGMEYASAGIPLNFGVGRALGSLGYACFSYLLGIWALRYGANVTLPYAAALSLLLFISILLWRDIPAQTASLGEVPGLSGGFFKRYPRFAVFVIGSFIAFVPYCMSCSFLVRIVENLGGDSSQLGTAILITALCEIPTALISLRLRKRFGSGKLMAFASAMLSLKALLLFLASSIGFLYAAVVSQLISYSLFIPVSVYYADARMQCGDKARGQAMMALVPTLSNAVGALLGGFLLRASDVHGMLLFCLICSCVGSVIMIAGVEKVQ